MFDLSLAEIALIVVVAVIFIGPKELPVVVKAVAKMLRSMRSLARDLHKAFDELTQESGLKDVKRDIEQEVRMIKGDDGKMYESYQLPVTLTEAKHE